MVLAIQHPASVPETCQSLEASFVPRSFRLGPVASPPVAPVWMSKKRRDRPSRIIIS